MLEQAKILGVIVTYAIYLLCSLTFVARLLNRPQLGRWFGYPLMLTALPLLYLLLLARQLERPVLYYVQIGLMLLYLLAESLLDYILKIGFRRTGWAVISYVVLFFAATGGMLGVAAYGDTIWAITAIGLFLAMAVLAFAQRAVTGT